MIKRVPIGVSSIAVLTLALACFVPQVASAAPIIPDFTVSPDGDVHAFAGTFGVDTDVALIQFVLGEGIYDFTASTTSYGSEIVNGFDPALWLYFAAPGSDLTDPLSLSLYTYPLDPLDPLNPAEITAQNDDQETGLDSLLTLQLTRAGTYILALTQTGNFGFEDSFGFDQSAFTCLTFNDDGTCNSFNGRTAEFAGSVQITNTSTVPEPGTLSLMALGSLATAALRRRHRAVVTTRQ
jgi:hypothetical protein